MKPVKTKLIDILLLLFIICLSIWIAYSHLTTRVNTIGRDYRFEQEWLVSAISIACGQGFTTPTAPYPPKMQSFLEQKTESMEFTDLPKDWSRWANSPFVKTHRYLITTIGYFWRLFGIHWEVLKFYAGVMFIITIVATYITIYMIAGRVSALITTVLVINAPSLLFLLPSIRDYSKTTFFMLFLAISIVLLLSSYKGTWKQIITIFFLGAESVLKIRR